MEATDSTKAIVAENNMRQRIRQSSMQWGIRPIDITPQLLREKGVLDIQGVMKVVVKLICEFYGIGLWELTGNSREFLMNKYGIPADKLETLYSNGDVALAYSEFAKHYNGDGKIPDDVKLDPLPTTTTVVSLPEEQVRQEEERMIKVGIENLKGIIANETDKDKKDLYEAQLKVLELKLKNAAAG